MAVSVNIHPFLEPGIYSGIVVGNMMPNNLVRVRLREKGDFTAVWACGIFSGLLGFKTSYVPPQGTPVVLLSVGPGQYFIVASSPQPRADKGMQERTITRSDEHNYHNAQLFSVKNKADAAMVASHKPPVDLAEGEIMIDNLIGVALTLLRGMASLSAGDLARVECHLLDDMVRIISDTFVHYTAFGDMRIVNDGGKLNVIWHGTSHDHEAWGLENEGDPKVKLAGSEDRVDLSNIDSTTDEGRWRFSQYIGWLGNFISMFVTDPILTLGKIAETPYRSGKAKLHVNTDGAIVIQTVADIVLEKVVRIPVPNQIRRDEDPKGNRADDSSLVSSIDGKQYLKTWKPSGDLFEMAFQIRDYARWLNNAYSLGRFRQLERDYFVPTEAQTPDPERDALVKEKEEVNSGIVNWQILYAAIRIYRDGSIQQVDAYGNSITMTKVGLQISTPQDLLLQAGGSINIMAGRDVNITGRQNVTLTAALQKLHMKAEMGINILSKAGHIFIETFDTWLTKFLCSVNVFNNVLIEKLTGNITTMGIVNVRKDVNIEQDLNVTGKTKLTDTTDMIGDAKMSGKVEIAKDVTIAANLDVKQTIKADKLCATIVDLIDGVETVVVVPGNTVSVVLPAGGGQAAGSSWILVPSRNVYPVINGVSYTIHVPGGLYFYKIDSATGLLYVESEGGIEYNVIEIPDQIVNLTVDGIVYPIPIVNGTFRVLGVISEVWRFWGHIHMPEQILSITLPNSTKTTVSPRIVFPLNPTTPVTPIPAPPAVPTVPPTQGEFNFEADGDYAPAPLYETITQQMMKDGEIESGGTWTFDAVNPVSGRGSPWPGQGKTQKVQRGADKLSIPQGKIPSNEPIPMTTESVVMKVN